MTQYSNKELALQRAREARTAPTPTVDRLDGLADILNGLGVRALPVVITDDAGQSREILQRSVAVSLSVKASGPAPREASRPIYYSAPSAVWGIGQAPRSADPAILAVTALLSLSGADVSNLLAVAPREASRLKLNGGRGRSHGKVAVQRGRKRNPARDAATLIVETPRERKSRLQRERRAAQRAS